MIARVGLPPAPPSISSEYSIISSFDVLSLSSATSAGPSSRSASLSPPHRTSSVLRSRRSSYQHVTREDTASLGGLSTLDTPSRRASAAISPEPSSHADAASTKPAGLSKAAARRLRKRKLEAGQKERKAAEEAAALLAEIDTVIDENIHLNLPTPPQTPISCQPHTPSPSSPVASPSRVRAETFEAGFLVVEDTETASKMALEGLQELETPEEQAGSEIQEKPRRKTRRGGVKARRRAGKLQIPGVTSSPSAVLSGDEREDGDERGTDTLSTPVSTPARPTQREATPVRAMAQESRPRITYNSTATAETSLQSVDDDAEEVDDLSALESELGTPVSDRRIRECSVMTVEDATSSIDSFLSDPRNFMTIKANKLRLWQSLCVELGLVHMPSEEAESTTVVAPTPPRSRIPTTTDVTESARDEGVNRPSSHPLPQTLTQARKLLKDHAHVNLVDYLEARRLCPPAYIGAYQGLLYPSKSSMLKYTKKQGKFAAKGMVKVEWLEPLMKDWRVTRRVGPVLI